MPSVTLITLYCRDLDASLVFYTALGFDFAEEQHGNGPRHFAASAASLVVELYPESERQPATHGLLIGIAIPHRQSCMEKIPRTAIVSEDWSNRLGSGKPIMLRDPDGNRLYLEEVRG